MIGSEAYFDWMVEMGAKFCWIFTYMPVGNGAPTDLMALQDHSRSAAGFHSSAFSRHFSLSASTSSGESMSVEWAPVRRTIPASAPGLSSSGRGGDKMPGFTKTAIMDAFLQLLEERPMERITVQDIVQRCGVSRNTFYYHYGDTSVA